VLPQALLDVLVCPRSKQPLVYLQPDQVLFCPASRLRYRVEQGVPVMLAEEAEQLTASAIDDLLARARAMGVLLPA